MEDLFEIIEANSGRFPLLSLLLRIPDFFIESVGPMLVLIPANESCRGVVRMELEPGGAFSNFDVSVCRLTLTLTNAAAAMRCGEVARSTGGVSASKVEGKNVCIDLA